MLIFSLSFPFSVSLSLSPFLWPYRRPQQPVHSRAKKSAEEQLRACCRSSSRSSDDMKGREEERAKKKEWINASSLRRGKKSDFFCRSRLFFVLKEPLERRSSNQKQGTLFLFLPKQNKIC